MGFGSYDESEQQNQDVDTDDSEAVNVHESEHEGESTFEMDTPTDELVGRLDEMKSGDEDE